MQPYGNGEDSNGRIASEDFENTQRYISIFGTRTRFVMMILLLLCLTSIWSNILTWNMALVCMSGDSSNSTNSTKETKKDNYQFSSTQRQYAISAVAAASLLGNFPIVYMVSRVQIRTVFTALGLLSGIATILLPFGIRGGYVYILALRALQGLAFASNFPIIGAFASKWIYFKQNGLFVSALVSYIQLAPAITNPVSGVVCDAFGWPWIFYGHGVIAIVLFLTYGLFYRNSPKKCVFVSQAEVNKIAIGKVAVDKRAKRETPYGPILKTPAVWAVWVAALGNFTCVNTLFLYSPQYLSKVLGYGTGSTGISAAIPPTVQLVVKVLCGLISDRIHFLTERTKFRIFNTIAFCGSSTFLVVLIIMPAGDPSVKTICNILLSGIAGVLGASTGGFFKNGPFLSKQYSYFVTGNLSLAISFTMLIVPFIVTFLAPDDTAAQWRRVFGTVVACLLVANVFFFIFVSGEPASWTRTDRVQPSAASIPASAFIVNTEPDSKS